MIASFGSTYKHLAFAIIMDEIELPPDDVELDELPPDDFGPVCTDWRQLPRVSCSSCPRPHATSPKSQVSKH